MSESLGTSAFRHRRAKGVFRRLLPRGLTGGGRVWLVSGKGEVLEGSGEALPGGCPARGSMAVRVGGAVWAPLGRTGSDGWLVVEDASTPAEAWGWMVKDAERVIELEEGSGQIAVRLAQAYEQMHAMFGLGRVADGASDVGEALTTALAKAMEGTPMGWAGIKFSDVVGARWGMAGRLLTFGEGGPRAEVLSGEADGLMSAGLEETVLLVDDRAKGALGSEAVAAPVRFEGKVAAVLLAGGKRPDDDGDPALSSFESQFLAACADLIGVIHENMARFAERKALFLGTVRALTSAIDAKHPYTRGHSDRVALLGKAMAKEIGLGDVVAETYHLAGLLHDVGKIGVSETILSKPSKLTDEEFAAIKTHPRVGHEILRDIPGLDDVLPGVLHHHEQWAGGGYPSRLKGEEIPLIARVLALADTFDAMSSSRSYREALSRETVLGEIRKCAGRQFEPGLAEAFVALDFTEYDAMAAGERAEARLAA